MNTDLLKTGEQIDDLQCKGLRIIQNPNQFCFGVDAVLLTEYAAQGIKKDARVLDLCSGNGIIPILLSAKSEAKEIIGLEIQEDVAEMASRSLKLNDLAPKVRMVCGDLKEATEYFKPSSFNNITCNPPYKEFSGGLKNADESKAIARHEIACTLEDVIRVSATLLEPGGKLCMVHRPERLIDIVTVMRKYKIEPKRLRFIHPYASKTANLILLEGTRQGKPKLFLDPPLYIYNERGEYTEEVNQIYGR